MAATSSSILLDLIGHQWEQEPLLAQGDGRQVLRQRNGVPLGSGQLCVPTLWAALRVNKSPSNAEKEGYPRVMAVDICKGKQETPKMPHILYGGSAYVLVPSFSDTCPSSIHPQVHTASRAPCPLPPHNLQNLHQQKIFSHTNCI